MYEKTISFVHKRKKLVKALIVADKLMCALVVALFAFVLLKSFLLSVMLGIKMGLVCMVPFLLVSFIRKKINAPRPNQICHFDGAVSAGKEGNSFPSRHAFSAFCISTVALSVDFPLGIIGIFVAVLISAIRVLLGYHFIRDVVAGSVIGIISGIIGALIF